MYTIGIYRWYVTASSKFGHCQPVMKKKPGVQGQLETEKYFEWVIIFIVIVCVVS